MAKYWFRQKSYGYGARPITWQGWVLTFVSCAAVFGVVMSGPAIRDNGLRALWIVLGNTLVLVPTIALIHAKTEGGWRWRWGSSPDNARDD
jgi:CBS-domain-containing membrane protein